MDMKISEKRLKELERAELKLRCLEIGGVDNWEWYGESLKDYDRTIQREENVEHLIEELAVILQSGAYEPSERGAGWAFRDDSLREANNYMMRFLSDFENEIKGDKQ